MKHIRHKGGKLDSVTKIKKEIQGSNKYKYKNKNTGLQVSSLRTDVEKQFESQWVGVFVAWLPSSTPFPSFIHPDLRPLPLNSGCFLNKERVFSTSFSALSITHDSHYA